MKALIDGDIILYACGFAAQHNQYSVRYEGNDSGYPVYKEIECENKKEANKIAKETGGEICNTIVAEPVANAINNMNTMVQNILERVNAKTFVVYISGKDNFRDKLVDDYKANRDPLHKPIHYDAMKNWLIDNLGAEIIDGQEADDAMSIQQYASYADFTAVNAIDCEAETIICTIDKDLNMVPGLHYNWSKDKTYVVTPLEGLRAFYKQLIQGDSTDNISGIYKLCGKKATKPLLSHIDTLEDDYDMWLYVKELYKGIDEETIVTNGRLLWMRRFDGQMWNPPQYPLEMEKNNEE